jgi:hypothetical protein
MATKKKTSPEPKQRNADQIGKPDVVGPGDIDAYPTRQAFELLTGGPIREVAHWEAFRVFHEAVAVTLSPTAKGSKWLARAASPFRWSVADLRTVVLDAITEYAKKPRGPEGLRSALCEADPRFGWLTDEEIEREFRRLKPGRKATGATNVQIPNVTAALTLSCGAFDEKQRTGESEGAAVRRIAKAFRQARERTRSDTR